MSSIRRSVALLCSLPLLAGCMEEPAPVTFTAPLPEVGFVAAGELLAPRYLHASVMLEGGQVLVCGGLDHYEVVKGSNPQWSEPVPLSSCEILDTPEGPWRSVADMVHPRLAHEMAVVAGGKVLAMGGQERSSYLSSSELFDPGSGAWRPVSSMAERRIHFTASYLGPEGTLLVAGGIADSVPGCEVFDTTLEIWSPTGPLAQPRSEHAAARLADGSILVSGGAAQLDDDPQADPVATAELFDPATRTWGPVGAFHHARRAHTLTPLPDGRAVAIGGTTDGGDALDSVEIFDPLTRLWQDGPPMQYRRVGHQATLLTGGQRLLVTGGLHERELAGAAEILDLASMTWETAPELVTPRHKHTAHLLPDGRVLVVGGSRSDGAPLRAVELFTPPCAAHYECAPGLRCAAEGVCVTDAVTDR